MRRQRSPNNSNRTQRQTKNKSKNKFCWGKRKLKDRTNKNMWVRWKENPNGNCSKWIERRQVAPSFSWIVRFLCTVGIAFDCAALIAPIDRDFFGRSISSSPFVRSLRVCGHMNCIRYSVLNFDIVFRNNPLDSPACIVERKRKKAKQIFRFTCGWDESGGNGAGIGRQTRLPSNRSWQPIFSPNKNHANSGTFNVRNVDAVWACIGAHYLHSCIRASFVNRITGWMCIAVRNSIRPFRLTTTRWCATFFRLENYWIGIFP